jgi:N-acylneuraminate cytidylyltransferase
MSIIAVILARAGSKRIPQKNIKAFCGEPLLSWPIKAAKQWGQFQEIMISTDSTEIEDFAKRLGATSYGLRSEKAANDTATTEEALIDALNQAYPSDSTPEFACCIYGSAAFVTSELLNSAYEMLATGEFDTVFPVIQSSKSIWRALRRAPTGNTQFIWTEHSRARSQDLEETYHDAGQFYMFRVEPFLTSKSLLSDRVGTIPVRELDCHDIDTLEDFRLAELKYSNREFFQQP